MDEARALLDALMGPTRNKASKEEGGEPAFADKKVCKNFLVAFCPHDWFTVNKRALEPCHKIHSEPLKEQFESHPDSEKYRRGWEREFLVYLEKITADCDAFIAKERLKCRPKGSQAKTTRLPPDIKVQYDKMQEEYAELIKEAEAMADESLSKSEELTKKALALHETMECLKARHTVEFPGEEVCEICGVRSVLESSSPEWHDRESHLRGRNHEGWTAIRTKLSELRKKRWAQDKETERELEREREKEREKRRERSRDRRERSRERTRERDRRRDRDRD